MGEVLRLPPAELRQGHAAAFEGVVTVFDSGRGLLIVQDGAGGILVSRPRGDEVAPGERVSVKGFSGYEGFTPIVVKATVERLGPARMPEPVSADAEALFRGALDFRVVELECRVESASSAGVRRFDLGAERDGRHFRISGTGDWTASLSSLVGHRVRVRGVPVTTFSPSGHPHSLQLLSGGPETFVPLSGGTETGPSDTSALGERKPDPALPQLTNVGQVKALANPEADRGYSARFRATVTNWDQGGHSFFAQDEAAAVYVISASASPHPVVAGDRVEIVGSTASGAFAPVIYAHSVRVLGHGPLPAPRKPRLSPTMLARDENIWAELSGVVQTVRQGPPGTTHLRLVTERTSIFVIIQGALSPEKRTRLENTRVRARGIFSPLYSSEARLTGFRLLMPSFDDIEILEILEGDSFGDEARPIRSLLEYHPDDASRERVKIAGGLTYVGFDGVTYLEDESGGIRLLDLPASAAGVGDHVEVLGFLAGEGSRVSLRSVAARASRTDRSADPLAITASDTRSGLYNARLVRVEGFLQGRRQSDGDRIFDLQAGRESFTAVLEHPQAFPEWESLRDGALLQLTGVCDNDWNLDNLPPTAESFRLLLRSPADIVVLSPAPWWTLGRALGLAASLLGALLMAALWVVTLRHRVAAQTSVIEGQMEERRSLEVQLRQVHRLESIGRLAGGIAHDFNNLLVVISGYSDLLRRQLAGQEKALGRLDQIKRAGDAAAALTRQLLAVSRQQVLRPVVVDLNELVAELDEMLRRLIGEDVELASVLSSRPLPILVDPNQIGQVIMNLAVNARDAMPDGGTLTLETTSVFLDDGYAGEHPGVSPGEHAVLSVSDTGVGMDEDTRSRVFEPFFTTKGAGKGTGLGLATAFGIVRQSGGHIWVYSEPGQGTTFKIYLPRAKDAAAETPLPPRPTSERGNGETILLVEDSAPVRQLAVTTLSELGYEVLDAPTGEDALELADKYPGDIDLLLTDVVLPGMNGRQLSDRLGERRRGLSTLYASGYTHDIIAHKGVLDSGINFLSKPYSPAELGAAVRAALARS